MTTYAALLTGAAEQIRLGAAPLRYDRFANADQAMGAIADFHAVLDAIASHTRRLLWPAQIRRVGLTTYRQGLPAIEAAAIHLATGIENLTGTRRPHPSQLTPASTPWLRAALHLRAASDLITTHFRPDGSPRTPDAAATDSHTLDVGLVALGHLAGSILAVEEPLALRAKQAHLNPAIITRHLPGLTHLADLARAIAANTAGTDEAARAHLAALPQTWTPIRTDDPIHELTDRMRRLRQVTFTITEHPADTLATLRDLTVVGVAVHAHTAAFHGANPTHGPDPAPGAHGTGGLILRGRAWQHLHRDLSHFITLAPPHPAVRDDVLALARVLAALAPLGSRTNTAASATTPDRRIGATLNGALATTTQIAEHAATAFDQLERSGTLHLRARDLPRDVLADAPALTQAHLTDAIVRAPAPVTNAIREALAIAANDPITRVPANSSTRAWSTPEDANFSAIMRADD